MFNVEQKHAKTIQETIELLQKAIEKLGTLMGDMPDAKRQKRKARQKLTDTIDKHLK